MESESSWKKRNVTIILLTCQVIFIVLFAFFGLYNKDADSSYVYNTNETDLASLECNVTEADYGYNLPQYYPMFQDVHVMIFVGFGFLMTFLKKYGFSSIGINFVLAAFVLQWALVVRGFLEHFGPTPTYITGLISPKEFTIGIDDMINADFAAGSVLISMGALLGKLSPEQYIVMGFFEVVIYAANEYILTNILYITDAGGSIIIHTFGAYFGLTVATVIHHHHHVGHGHEGTLYHSDLFSMIGTVFLWMFWPSFNGALSPTDEQYRAVINTYISLAACCVVTFAISSLVSKEGKFEMVHIQNASLAGGVAMGTSANLMVTPYGSAIIGSLAAILSVMGYKYITPFLSNKLHIHDTCGVNNLHGMPGILAALIGALISGLADFSTYGFSLYCIFPAMSTSQGSRSALTQAGFQVAGLATALAMAIVGGIIVGLILRLPIWTQLRGDSLFSDEDFWEIPPELHSKHLLEAHNRHAVETDLIPPTSHHMPKHDKGVVLIVNEKND